MGGSGSTYKGPDVLGTRKLNRDFKKMAEDAKKKAKKQGKNYKKAKKRESPTYFGGAIKNVKMKPKKK